MIKRLSTGLRKCIPGFLVPTLRVSLGTRKPASLPGTNLRNAVLRLILPLGLALLLLLASSGVQPVLTSGPGAQSGGNYDVQWNVIGGSAGEGFVAGGNYQLGFTLAQAQEPQISSGGSYKVVGGFWLGGSSGQAPGSETVYLPIILKNSN